MVDYPWEIKAVVFVCMGGGITAAKWFIALIIPDMTRETKIQLQRQEYITDKIINLYREDENDEDDDSAPLSTTANYSIRGFDDDPM